MFNRKYVKGRVNGSRLALYLATIRAVFSGKAGALGRSIVSRSTSNRK
jgi:hypothetical protein